MTPPAAATSVQPRARLAPTPPRPRRVSGPARPARGTAPKGKASQDGLLVGVLGAAETISSHRLLDRLIRGRLWIGLVAFALIGIVTLQLGLLKLNSGIGRALERTAALQRENAALSIENSELAGGDRVESQAERLGMKLVPVSGLHFLSSHARSDVAHAVSALRDPVRPASESNGTSEEATSTAPESTTPATAPSSGSESTGSSASTEAAATGSSGEPAPSAPATSEPAQTPPSAEPEGSSTAASGAPVNGEADGGTASPAG